MINKIVKLKDFGIYHDYTWKAELPEFNRFNLIYGWNRSGKTTLSRVFSACEKKLISFKQYPKAGIFEIKPKTGINIKSLDITNCNLPIRVFNKDFIDDNISFNSSDSCNPIVYVSEEDIENKKKLEKLQKNQRELNEHVESAQKNKGAKEEIKSNFLTSLGREIANVLFDKTYNKTKTENKIKEIGIDNFSNKIISDDNKKKLEEISKSNAKEKQDYFSKYQIDFAFSEEVFSNFTDVFSFIQKLLQKEVISETLDRLKDDKILNNWVKQGFDLYKSNTEKTKCLFCQKPLNTDFIATLSKHFSEDYDNLQNNITSFISKLIKLKKDPIATKNDALYPDLKNIYQNQAKDLNNIIEKMNTWIDSAISGLNEKFDNPLTPYSLAYGPEKFNESYNNKVKELNDTIKAHNEKIDNHQEEVETAKDKLELHLIAESIEEQNYNKVVEDCKKSIEEEKTAKLDAEKNNAAIKELEQKTSNIGKAVKKINNHLEEFFSKKEIQLELDNHKKGYLIKRNNQFADNLSEGEKTAIAFSYFIVKTQERGFKIKDSIIFIDDPVSSFDSNFIYHCFSLIQNHFKGAGQLFVSTHNFELFNLVKGWFGRKNKKDTCNFYMIENFEKDEKRMARIKPLDETLRKFQSEYHFLFHQLNSFSQTPSLKYTDLYTIGNIGRRFLEIFTNFKIPTTGDLKSKIEALQIDTEKVSEVERDKAYKLIQEFSHGSDPTSTIEHKDKSEIKEAVNILLKIVKESDPKHFELLERNT